MPPSNLIDPSVLENSFSKLTKDERMLEIVKRYSEGYSAARISSDMNVPRRTVYNDLGRHKQLFEKGMDAGSRLPLIMSKLDRVLIAAWEYIRKLSADPGADSREIAVFLSLVNTSLSTQSRVLGLGNDSKLPGDSSDILTVIVKSDTGAVIQAVKVGAALPIQETTLIDSSHSSYTEDDSDSPDPAASPSAERESSSGTIHAPTPDAPPNILPSSTPNKEAEVVGYYDQLNPPIESPEPPNNPSAGLPAQSSGGE